jgi:hypothetical protein
MYRCIALSVRPCTSVVVPYGQCVTNMPVAMCSRYMDVPSGVGFCSVAHRWPASMNRW